MRSFPSAEQLEDFTDIEIHAMLAIHALFIIDELRAQSGKPQKLADTRRELRNYLTYLVDTQYPVTDHENRVMLNLVSNLDSRAVWMTDELARTATGEEWSR